MNNQKTICIAGIGNILRSDDGIGAFVCQVLENENIPNASFHYPHQLQTEWLDEFSRYDYVLLIDAIEDGTNDIQLYPLKPGGQVTQTASHYLDTGILTGLFTGLYDKSPQIFICAIAGNDFSFGETLSDQGKINADKAVGKIKSWLKEEGFIPAPGSG
jgi:hydrogenase maturation protease